MTLVNARLYAEAQEASRLKDEFLAVVSHELRTPLNAILGWSYLMKDDVLDEQSFRHALDAVERNARAQARIIDDVLDVSRIIRGNLKISPKLTNLSALVAAAVDSVRPGQAVRGPLDHASRHRVRVIARPPERVGGHRRPPADAADEHHRRLALE